MRVVEVLAVGLFWVQGLEFRVQCLGELVNKVTPSLPPAGDLNRPLEEGTKQEQRQKPVHLGFRSCLS
jgi:hypothetical protein